MDLITPKVAAKHEQYCSTNRPLITIIKIYVFAPTTSPLYTVQYEAGLLKNRSCLAAALGVTEFIACITMIIVTLCCAA